MAESRMNSGLYRFVFGNGLPAIFLVAIVAGTVFRPGDAPWVADEPLLVHGALYMNSTPGHFWGMPLPFSPAPYGLLGTHGVHYGPLAVWIDQIFLAFTHDPIVMVAVRAGVVAIVNALALFWLTKSLRVTPWLAVVIMLSPWLWIYCRQLWDNSLCVPLSAMLLAAYADFIVRRRAWSLRLAVLCGMLLLLVHLMAIALIAAIGLHLCAVEFRSIWRFKWSLLAIVASVTAISWQYWYYLLHNHAVEVPGGTSPWRGYFFPLLGAHHLTASGLENNLGDAWAANRSPVFLIARWISLGAFPAVWVGMILALPGLWRVLRLLSKADGIDQIFAVAWAAVIFQAALDGLQHVYDGPHYFNATWIVYAAFLLRVARHAPAWAIATYAAALLLVTITIAVSVAENAGMRSANYDSDLWEQIQAVRDIEKYSGDSPINIDIAAWTRHPIALTTLGELIPPGSGQRPQRQIWVHYRDDSPSDAHIAVTAY
jgi:hypothetical protein